MKNFINKYIISIILLVFTTLLITKYYQSSRQIPQNKATTFSRKVIPLNYKDYTLLNTFNKKDIDEYQTAAGAYDIQTIASEVTSTMLTAFSNSTSKSLPLVANWNVGIPEYTNGMDPLYMISRFTYGEHLVPTWKLDPYYNDNIGLSYYETSIKKAAKLGLPLVFILPSPESALTKDDVYFSMDRTQNPNVITVNGTVLPKLSPFGPDSLWNEVGEQWSTTSLIAQLQEWYPNPPLVVFMDEDNSEKLSWSKIASSSRYIKQYPTNTSNEFKRTLVNAKWLEKYRQLHEGFKKGFTKKAWKQNVKFVTRNQLASNMGVTSDWMNAATTTNQHANIWPLTADGLTIDFNLGGDKTDTANAPHRLLNNLPFMIEEAKELNPNFTYQLSIDANQKIDNPQRYRGFTQFALWFLRPSIIRQTPNKTIKDEINPLFQQVTDSVELIHNSDILANFWKDGKLVSTGNSNYNQNIPTSYQNIPREFLLKTDATSSIWAFALEKGKAPNREWLVYIQSPEENMTNITVSIPNFNNTALNSTQEGNLYIIKEKTSSTTTDTETVSSTTTDAETVSSTTTDTETVSSTTTDAETVSSTTTDAKTVSSTTTDAETVSSTTTDAETVSSTTIENNQTLNTKSNASIQDRIDNLLKSTRTAKIIIKNYQPDINVSYGKEFFVSEIGNDNNPGTIEKPFATLQKARDSIRIYKQKNGIPLGGIAVLIREGTYSLLTPFELTAKDSGEDGNPIIYSAYNKEKVRLIGGIDLNESWFKPITKTDIMWNRLKENIRENINVVDLKAHNINDIGNINDNYSGARVLEVFENDKAMNIARWPDFNQTTIIPSLNDTQIHIYGNLSPNVTGTYIKQATTIPTYKRDGLVNGKQYYIKRIEGKDETERRYWRISDENGLALWSYYGGGYNLPREFNFKHINADYGIPSLLKDTDTQFGFAFMQNGINDTTFTVNIPNLAKWANNDDIWINGMLKYAWYNSMIKIKNIDKKNQVITLDSSPGLGIKKGDFKQPFYIFNVLEELNEPGEYYVDKENLKLYLYPTDNSLSSEITISLNKTNLIELNNVSNITLKNLNIEIGRQTLINIKNGQNNLITHCSLKNSGRQLIKISGKNNGISYCDLNGMGDEGVNITGGDRATLTAANNFISNNYIHGGNRWKWTYKGAIKVSGVGNIIEHNDIENFMHLGIYFSGNNHLIKYNNIAHVLQYAEDSGAIYSGRQWAWRNNQIAYNFIHDIQNNYGGSSIFAVYFDDSLSGNQIIGNIFHNIDGGAIMLNGGRDTTISNNIFNKVATCFVGTNYGIKYINNIKGSSFNMLERLSENNVNYQSDIWKKSYPRLAKIPNNWEKVKESHYLAPEGNIFVDNMFINILKKARVGAVVTDFDDKNIEHYEKFNLEDNSSIIKFLPFQKIGIQVD